MSRGVILLVGAALCLAGCLTVEKADLPGAEPGKHVMVRNHGKYLFDCVPVGCGNADENAKCGFVMFRNDVTMDKMQHRFLAECRKAGGEPTDVAYHTDHNIFLTVPLFSVDIPIPYLWTTRVIQITGTVK